MTDTEHAPTPVPEPETEPAPAPEPTEKSSIGARIDRAFESMRVKNAKLQVENRKLKELLALARSGSTRISRIPKPPKKLPEKPVETTT